MTTLARTCTKPPSTKKRRTSHAATDAQLAVAEPADQRRAAGQHAQLAVVHRQGHEVGRFVEQRLLRRDDHALQFTLGMIWHVAYFPSPAMRLACSAASSMPPTYMNAVFGQMVPLALAQLLEAADRLGERRHLALLAGERLGHDERLRQELLDAPGPVHDLLVFLAQLLDAEDGDDVLQFAVALQDLLHAAGDGVVLLADVLRIENVGCTTPADRRRVDALLGNAAVPGR